jgi:hypothetical protein
MGSPPSDDLAKGKAHYRKEPIFMVQPDAEECDKSSPDEDLFVPDGLVEVLDLRQ